LDTNIIGTVPLFAELSEEDRNTLTGLLSETNLKRGESLFHEGDAGDRLYIIVDGKIKLGHLAADGRENLIAILGPREILGELSLFDLGSRSTTATAVAPTKLVSLSHKDMMGFIETHPQLAKQMLRSLAQRLRKTNDQMADLVFADVPGRVAKELLNLAKQFGERTQEGIYVAHELTQEEIAHLVGASRETVNKSLAEFLSRGWIRLEGRLPNLNGELDLHGGVQRQCRNSHGRAGVYSGVGENLLEQLRSAIDHGRLASEVRDRGNIAGDVDNALDVVNTAGGLSGCGEGVENALAGSAVGFISRNQPAHLAFNRKAAVNKGELARRANGRADAECGNVGSDGRGNIGKGKPEVS